MVFRPDIAYAIGILARHSSSATAEIWPTIFERGSPVQEVPHFIEASIDGGDVANSGRGSAKRKIDSISEDPSNEMSYRLKDRVPVAVPNQPTHHVDADFGGDKITRRSMSGYVVMFTGDPVA